MKKLYLYILILLVLSLAVVFLLKDKRPSEEKLIQYKNEFNLIQLQVFSGSLLADYQGNGKCLLLYSKNSTPVDELKLYINQISSKESITSVIPVSLGTVSKSSETVVAASDFDKAIKENYDCDIIISLLPLTFKASELSKIEILNKESDVPVRFGIFDGKVGSLEPYLFNGRIHTMTQLSPDAYPIKKVPPKNLMIAFAMRYILINQERLGMVKKEYPTLFHGGE